MSDAAVDCSNSEIRRFYGGFNQQWVAAFSSTLSNIGNKIISVDRQYSKQQIQIARFHF